jgi:hypothetical protein
MVVGEGYSSSKKNPFRKLVLFQKAILSKASMFCSLQTRPIEMRSPAVRPSTSLSLAADHLFNPTYLGHRAEPLGPGKGEPRCFYVIP